MEGVWMQKPPRRINHQSKGENMQKMSQQTADRSPDTVNSELHELLFDELANIVNAEEQLSKALPKMAAAAVSAELTVAFESHIMETKHHMTRLEEVFASLDEPIQSRDCKAMKGLLAECEAMMEDMTGASTMDAALIAAAQKVEHYEIAAYGAVCAWAAKMGYEEAAELLSATLEEEKTADEILTQIAENTIDEVGD